MTRRWERFWFDQVSSIRPYLLVKGLLLLLAFDCWFNLIPHGGRYGAAEFNVAHFPPFDYLPAPTPDVYIAAVTACGLLALSMVIFRPSRWLLAVLAISYTYAWSSSMLDSYQHHYLLSLILLSMIFFPLEPVREVQRYEETIERGSAWAFVMVGVTCTIVYFYTAVTKLEPSWRNGDALRRLIDTSNMDRLEPVLDKIGLSANDPYQVLAVATISLQLITALGYLLAINQNRLEAGWWSRHAWLLLPAPLAFHVGAELMELKIGWFSYYMILIAVIYFAPERKLDQSSRVITWLPRMSSLSDEDLRNLTNKDLRRSLMAAVPAIAFAVALCTQADLPGVTAGALVAGVAMLLGIVLEVLRPPAPLPFTRATSFVGATVIFMFVVTLSTVRFDYYRYAAGDHRVRGDYAGALELYEKANRYAPKGEDRKKRIEEMRLKVKRSKKAR